MTSISTFSWLWVQDVHFGVTSVPVGAIANSFKRIYNLAKRRGISKVVFGGDTTDRPLSLVNDYASEFITFAVWLLKDCAENNIDIIVIEGTPSHDWKQARIFEHLKAELKLDVNLVYITKLAIINLADFGNVLIVPDQWRPNAATTLAEIKSIMQDLGISKVDYAFMHGHFKYQVPKFLRNRLDLHDEDIYSDLVSKGIFIGHEHVESRYKNINCAGPIERMRHGSEDEKGGLLVEDYRNGDIHVEFLRNPNAQIFKDVFVDGLSSDEILNKLDAANIDLNQHANIRLVVLDNAQVASEFIKRYKLVYPDIRWSSKCLNSKSESSEEFELEQADMDFITANLDKDTIIGSLMKRVADKYPDKLDGIKSILDASIAD